MKYRDHFSSIVSGLVVLSRLMALPTTVCFGIFVFALAPVSTAWAALAADAGNRPPASTQLAFVRDGQIYRVNADGTGLVQLTNTGGDVGNWDPTWSPDGLRLAFARSYSDGSGFHETSEIYMMNADGSNVVQLTNEGSGAEPAWRPDGGAIVFTSVNLGSAALSVIDIDADGSQGSRVLLDYPGWDAQPAWSPDGQTITFSSDFEAYDFVYGLYTMNADGSNVRPLFQGDLFGSTYYHQPAWSPDGLSIGVVLCDRVADNCYPDSAIAVANADGSGLRAIANAGSYASPTWSPDGRWIAYGSSRCRTCQSSIRYVQVDGDLEGLVVDNGHSPSWRPDSGARINVGHSGAWFSPATRGQGQFLNVEPAKQFVFLGWMTYTDHLSEFPNQQHWFTAEGNYYGNKAELILYESLGGGFNQPQSVTTTPVGEVTLTFSDCGQGTMSYRFDDRDLEGSFPMNRPIPGSGNVCESSSESTTQAVNVNHGMDGAWSNPNIPGQGFFFDVHADDTGSKFIFGSWFTYGDDTASGQRWLTAEGQFAGSKADLIIYDTNGGSFDDPHPAESVQVGTMSIHFSDCGHAVLSYSLPDEDSEGTIDIQRAVPGSQSLCEELNASR